MDHLLPRGAYTETGAQLEPQGQVEANPVARVIHPTEDDLTVFMLKGWLIDNTQLCVSCGKPTPGNLLCGLCADDVLRDV